MAASATSSGQGLPSVVGDDEQAGEHETPSEVETDHVGAQHPSGDERDERADVVRIDREIGKPGAQGRGAVARRNESRSHVGPEREGGVRAQGLGGRHLGQWPDGGGTLSATRSRLEGVDHGGRLDRVQRAHQGGTDELDVRGDGVVVEARR